MQFSINEHVYNSKIPPITYKKLLLNLFKNIFYFAVQIITVNLLKFDFG
jgi:hypothetical protein